MSSTPQKNFFFLEHRSHENTPFGHFLMWRSTPHQESTPHQGKNTPHQEKTYAASGFGNAQARTSTHTRTDGHRHRHRHSHSHTTHICRGKNADCLVYAWDSYGPNNTNWYKYESLTWLNCYSKSLGTYSVRSHHSIMLICHLYKTLYDDRSWISINNRMT